jgi:hypothetical protein
METRQHSGMFRRCALFVSMLMIFGSSPGLRAAAAAVFDSILAKENLWSLSQDEFQQGTRGLPFEWTSNARDSARAARPGMSLFGQPVYELVARFDGGKLKEIAALFYARGDAGDLSEAKFQELLRNSTDAISKFTNAKLTVRGKDATSAVKAEGLIWQTDKGRFLLEYSFTREVKSRSIPFRAEFVRLEITPPEKKLGLLQSLAAGQRTKFSANAHVKRDTASGDVWLQDVPMVDQGQKGYCVVASTERVMRYYGNPVDANELAQVANTQTEGGTNPMQMNAALKKLAARLKVRVRPIEENDVRSILELVKDYNRAAKRAKKPEIPDPGLFIDVGRIYGAMEFDVLKEARTKNRSELTRFQRTVQSHVDQGIPLLWSVQLGLATEPGVPQSGGGHMRLIIGYNTTTQEILFSDSWGAGHELKRMPVADAWAITTGLTTLEPF